MKKFVVLLLALTVLAGAVFAQATVNGYNRAITTFTEDEVSLTNRLRLNLSFKDPDGNFGFFSRLRLEGYSTVSVRYAYGWVKLADGKVKVTAGELGNYDYGIYSGVSDTQLGNIASDTYVFDRAVGVLLQLYPVDGLDIGFALLPSDDLDLADFSLNAKYDIEGIGSILFSSMGAADLADAMASIAFQYTGFEGLSAAAGFMYGGRAIGIDRIAETNSIFAAVNYAAGAFSAEIAPNYNITDSELYIEGYVGYTVGAFSFNVIGAYDKAGDTLGDGLGSDATYGWVDADDNPVTADTWGIVDAAVAPAPSTYFFGVEANYMVGKATLTTGFYYDEVAKWSIPFVVKVAF